MAKIRSITPRSIPARKPNPKPPRNSSRYRGAVVDLPRDPDASLDVEQTAYLLNIPVSHVYAETRKGEASWIPFRRQGRFVRTIRREVLAARDALPGKRLDSEMAS